MSLPGMTIPPRRIALIHALRESIDPAHEAFSRLWPQASSFDLLDNSLATAVADSDGVTGPIIDRFLILARYAASSRHQGRPTDAILFTCSAFGTAIDAVEQELSIPVHRPNAAAFEHALASKAPVSLLVTFPPSLAPMMAELHAMAANMSGAAECRGHIVEGAFDALRAGNNAEHDRRVAAAAAECAQGGIVILGQFSMAAAAVLVDPSLRGRVLTTPECAVKKLRSTLCNDHEMQVTT